MQEFLFLVVGGLVLSAFCSYFYLCSRILLHVGKEEKEVFIEIFNFLSVLLLFIIILWIPDIFLNQKDVVLIIGGSASFAFVHFYLNTENFVVQKLCIYFILLSTFFSCHLYDIDVYGILGLLLFVLFDFFFRRLLPTLATYFLVVGSKILLLSSPLFLSFIRDCTFPTEAQKLLAVFEGQFCLQLFSFATFIIFRERALLSCALLSTLSFIIWLIGGCTDQCGALVVFLLLPLEGALALFFYFEAKSRREHLLAFCLYGQWILCGCFVSGGSALVHFYLIFFGVALLLLLLGSLFLFINGTTHTFDAYKEIFFSLLIGGKLYYFVIIIVALLHSLSVWETRALEGIAKLSLVKTSCATLGLQVTMIALLVFFGEQSSQRMNQRK